MTTFSPTQEQLDFYQQLYTLQKRNKKHFHWTYSMFHQKFGEFPIAEIKKQKKVVPVTDDVLSFVNQKYKLWHETQGTLDRFKSVT